MGKPFDVVIDRDGAAWVTSSATDQVFVFNPDGSPRAGSPYTGGGLTVPWGIATDGADNVWVANFGGKRVSQFCGAKVSNCPSGFVPGQPISPAVGYAFNGLQRNTAVNIDASGNVWLANNWKQAPIPTDPGGDGMVAIVGVAVPVRMPLIGPPQQP